MKPDAEKLTDDQASALDDIRHAERTEGRALLTGAAGCGKTTLLQHYARDVQKRGKSIAMSAPTHQAARIIKDKIEAAGLDGIPCLTIHSLLQLQGVPDGDRMKFVRKRGAEPVQADVVVIDECSMVDSDLMRHIRRHLPRSFVLFSGDRAQLPPVGEVESQSFAVTPNIRLEKVIRQAEGNPILAAAHTIRASQGGVVDWSWVDQVDARPCGVYLPGSGLHAWMRKAFTSKDFENDPNSWRYLAWTNRRVAEANTLIRRWRYGDNLPTPFMPGERVLLRAPVMQGYLAWTNRRVAEANTLIRRWRYGDNLPTPFMPGERVLLRAPVMQGEDVLFNTNDEARVVEIGRSEFNHEMAATGMVSGWLASLPTWEVVLERDSGARVPVHMPANDRDLNRVLDRIKDDACDDRQRWHHFHQFKSSLARMQSCAAMTVHCSQGATFDRVFMDVGDIRRQEKHNPLEMTKMLYTAITRPRYMAILANV